MPTPPELLLGFVIGLAVRLLFKPYAAWAIELATGLLTALFIRLLGELLDEESGWKIGWFVIPIGIPLALALGWIVRQTAGLTFTAFCSIGFVLGLAILAASDKPFKGMHRILKAACTWLLFDDNGYVGHFVLRLFLWYAKVIPWNYSRFLDYSAERVLLRKVGSSYIFVHRLLLEYFASLDSTPIHDETGAQKQRVLPVS